MTEISGDEMATASALPGPVTSEAMAAAPRKRTKREAAALRSGELSGLFMHFGIPIVWRAKFPRYNAAAGTQRAAAGAGMGITDEVGRRRGMITEAAGI